VLATGPLLADRDRPTRRREDRSNPFYRVGAWTKAEPVQAERCCGFSGTQSAVCGHGIVRTRCAPRPLSATFIVAEMVAKMAVQKQKPAQKTLRSVHLLLAKASRLRRRKLSRK